MATLILSYTGISAQSAEQITMTLEKDSTLTILNLYCGRLGEEQHRHKALPRCELDRCKVRPATM